MVHNLTDRDLWRIQGEAYLRKIRNRPPAHPLLAAAAQARNAAKNRERDARPAA